MDAIGIYRQMIPPFIIFKGQQYINSLWEIAEEAVGDCLIKITENGWLNEEMGFKWLKHFKQYTRRIKAWEASKIDSPNIKYYGY